MRLEDSDYDNQETGCCARLDPEAWDARRFQWTARPFLRDRVRSFLHVPLNFASVVTRAHEAVEAAEAYPKRPFWLTHQVSPWASDFLIALDHEVPSTRVERLSGSYLTRMFVGPYRHVRAWIQEMDRYVLAQGFRMRRALFYYGQCPRCARHYGENQVVLFAELTAPSTLWVPTEEIPIGLLEGRQFAGGFGR